VYPEHSVDTKIFPEEYAMCNIFGGNGNSCLWIIILLIIVFCCCGGGERGFGKGENNENGFC
jgi:hypothetical protein